MAKAATVPIVLLDQNRANDRVVEVASVPEFRHRGDGAYYDFCDVAVTDRVHPKTGEVLYPAGTRRYAWSGKA